MRHLLFAALLAGCANTKSKAPTPPPAEPALSEPAAITPAPATTTPDPKPKGDLGEPLPFTEEAMEECCTQCLLAVSMDPSGLDLSNKQCHTYEGYEANGKVVMNEMCGLWFQTHKLSVNACQNKSFNPDLVPRQ